MFKLNLVEDHGPMNLEPATLKDVMIIFAAAIAAAGLITFFLMLIFNLVFSSMQ